MRGDLVGDVDDVIEEHHVSTAQRESLGHQLRRCIQQLLAVTSGTATTLDQSQQIVHCAS